MAHNPRIPSHLHYDLTRSQRLIPHFGVWGPMSYIIPAIFIGLIVLAALSSWWVLLALLPLLLIFRGFFVGLLNVAFFRIQSREIVIGEETLGFVAGGELWHLFLDGIIGIQRYREDVWTIEHFNGSVVNILASEISDDQIEYLRNAARRGQTADGVQAVVERGRLFEQLESEEFLG